jgi:hypothetical protein
LDKVEKKSADLFFQSKNEKDYTPPAPVDQPENTRNISPTERYRMRYLLCVSQSHFAPDLTEMGLPERLWMYQSNYFALPVFIRPEYPRISRATSHHPTIHHYQV